MRLSDLQSKDIINIANGKKIGVLIDVVIDCKCGKILALVIDESSRITSIFTQSDELEIPWCNIIKIGEDVIIVDCTCTVEYDVGNSCNI